MKRPIPALAALLAVQLLLAAGLAAAAARRSSGRGEAPLLSFDAGAVDRIVVEGPSGARATLARKDGAWVLPELGGFPTEAGKADRLLTRLADLRRGEPVATSAEAAARFKVADAGFERRITLEAGGEAVASLLVGSAAAMRSVHARAGGSGDVHLVELSAWEVPATAAEWLDKDVLRIPRSEIEAIETGGVKLERVAAAAPPAGAPAGGPGTASTPTAPAPAPTWRATGLPKGAPLDQAAADELASALADLSIKGVLGTEPQAAWGLDRPALTVAVRRAGGSTLEYRLAKPAGAQDWVLRSSTRPEHFEVAAWVAEALRKAADPKALAGGAGGKGGPPGEAVSKAGGAR